MLVVETPRPEEKVLAPVDPNADQDQIMEDIREWASQCVNHLCGCNCSC